MALKLLLDTNAWLDFFLDRSVTHDQARRIVVESTQRGIELMCAVHSMKDCYFLLYQEVKRMERAQNGDVTEQSAAAIREVAWSCVKSMRKLAYVVPADDSDVIEAAIMRAEHPDFEDNLIIAAAHRVQANHVVTSDAILLAHYPDLCVDMEETLRLIAA